MSLLSQVRFAGAQTRAAMMAVYDKSGDSAGAVFGERFLWEIGEAMAEVRGPRAAAEALYRIADAIAGRRPCPDLLAEKTEAKADELGEALDELDELRAAFEEIDSAPPPPMLWRVSPVVAVALVAVGAAIGWALALWKHTL